MLKPQSLIKHFWPSFAKDVGKQVDSLGKLSVYIILFAGLLVLVLLLVLASIFSPSRKFAKRKLKELKANLFHNGIIRSILLSSMSTDLLVGNSY